jgi:hypothetical protein
MKKTDIEFILVYYFDIEYTFNLIIFYSICKYLFINWFELSIVMVFFVESIKSIKLTQLFIESPENLISFKKKSFNLQDLHDSLR